MINIAVMGYGTIGAGVAEVLLNNENIISKNAGDKIIIKKILDIKDIKDNNAHLQTKNFDDILNDPDINVVVESIGGTKHSYEFTKKLLQAGKNVVTPNKELVSVHGTELLEIAKNNNVRYMFEASVGGGIPVITPMIDSFAANEITEIHGILNGTTNYILTEMKNGISFDNALQKAQANGYAEANPADDIDGHDACRKICILAALAFGKLISPQKVNTCGIRDITLEDIENIEKNNCTLKLIASAVKLSNGKIYLTVTPRAVKNTNPLYSVNGVYNGILINGNAVGDVMFYGRGAGMYPTSSAVIADIIHIASHKNNQHEQINWTDGNDLFIGELPSDVLSGLNKTIGESLCSIKIKI